MVIEDRWVVVPQEKVLVRVDNPTGNGVVCYMPPANIMCFVRTTEG